MFYIYENWMADNKAKIHKGECSHCNDGMGKHPDKEEGRNGQWHGPFDNYQEAREHAETLKRTISDCGFCL